MYQEKVLLSFSKDKNSKKYNNKQKKTNKLSSCKKLWNVSRSRAILMSVC